MSTGCNCLFFESKNNKWYYVLEHSSAPRDSYDWTEYADVVGPFVSFDAANTYLHENNANPGGYSQYAYDEKDSQTKHEELIARAQKPRNPSDDLLRFYRFRY